MERLDNWLANVSRLLERNYAITIADAGIDRDDLGRYFQGQPKADAFVEWFAEKYDLERVPDSKSALATGDHV